MYKIVIDTMGSDKGPEMIVKGAALALEKHVELEVCLVGDKDFILGECEKQGLPMERVEILHASDVMPAIMSGSMTIPTIPTRARLVLRWQFCR